MVCLSFFTVEIGPDVPLLGYWNEARILEPVNFDTIQELPNIPGNVNNFLAGRTYPLEGAAVPLPLHAPYTDPLEILICGGSTVGAAEASDNCVSLQPEAAQPQWVLERMVSSLANDQGTAFAYQVDEAL